MSFLPESVIVSLRRGSRWWSAICVAVLSGSVAAAVFPASAPSARAGVDHGIYRAGQHVNFHTGSENGRTCTGAFVARVPESAQLVALSAGHCAAAGWVAWRVEPWRGTTSAGVPFGSWIGGVLASFDFPEKRYAEEVDVLAFSVARPVAQEIERGAQRPLRVTGWVRTDDQRMGMRVCFAGRTSGADRCGKIIGRFSAGPGRGVVCADIPGDRGDSGGPVYLDPATTVSRVPTANIVTRAVGIVSQSGTVSDGRPAMCYTPIENALNQLRAVWYNG